MQARQFLHPGEQGLILFTRGPLLTINWSDQTGQSGTWVINAQRHIDRGGIYHRDDETQQNTIYLATYAGVEPAEGGHRRIQLAHIQDAETTDVSWKILAETEIRIAKYRPKHRRHHKSSLLTREQQLLRGAVHASALRA